MDLRVSATGENGRAGCRPGRRGEPWCGRIGGHRGDGSVEDRSGLVRRRGLGIVDGDVAHGPCIGIRRVFLELVGHDVSMPSTPDSVKARLQADLTAAMKARDEVTLSTVRMVRAAIMNAEVAGTRAVELTDDEVLAVVRSEAKKRAESAEVYEQNDRPDAAAKERAELAVIERYLPAAMADEELSAIVDDEIATAAAAGADGAKAMGAVIKAVRDRAGATADGGRIAALVKQRLAT